MKKMVPLLFLFFTSCDALVKHEFRLRNNTGRDLSVAYSVEGKDSVVAVPAQTSRILFRDVSVGSPEKDVYEKGMSPFQYIFTDTLPQIDTATHLQRNAWTMEWKNGHEVVYTLTHRIGLSEKFRKNSECKG